MTDAAAFDDLVDGGARRVDLDLDGSGESVAVALVRIGDDVHAIADTCSHANVSLSDGEVWCDELEIECPKHSSAFDLRTGEPATLPATQPVEVFDVEIADGRVRVTRREGSGS